MAPAGLITAIILLSMMMVDGCPVVTTVNGSCCETKGNSFRFSHPLHRCRVYNITNFCGDCELVAEGYCDAATAGGGWLVIQRRKDGSVDFNRNWVDYEDGFGKLTGEFWYGLRAIHCLSNQGQWEIRIDYTFTTGETGYLSYSNFRVGPAAEQYKLTISGYHGTDQEQFTYNNGAKFTTKDIDNDQWGGRNKNCAVSHADGNAGGWWYKSCSNMYLNHQYKNQHGIHANSKWIALSFVEMKIRPTVCS